MIEISLLDFFKNKKQEKLDEDVILSWFIQLCLGIQYLHDHHLVHKELAPQHIYITESNNIKLDYLGIEKLLSLLRDVARLRFFVPNYDAPENVVGLAPYTKKSNIWSLGMILYELCTLKHPFFDKNIDSDKILKEGKCPSIPDQYSRDIQSIIEKMISINPDDRPEIGEILQMPLIKSKMSKLNIDPRIQESVDDRNVIITKR